jgi:hypothetical protein
MTATLPSRFPLSPPQRDIWFVDQVPGGEAVYVMGLAFVFEGPCDVGTLTRAVADVEWWHPLLGVRFAADGDHVYQKLADKPPVRMPLDDLRQRAMDITSNQ